MTTLTDVILRMHSAIEKVCPIHGVAYSNDGTWRIDFVDEATAEQRSAAITVRDSFDPFAVQEQDYAAAVQLHIEKVARDRGYNDAVTCTSYAVSTVPEWSAEGRLFSAWRDAVWTYVYTQLSAVQSQQREKPTIDALIAELPAMKWER